MMLCRLINVEGMTESLKICGLPAQGTEASLTSFSYPNSA